MPRIPTLFTKATEGTFASLDFFDFLTGIGYKTFYATGTDSGFFFSQTADFYGNEDASASPFQDGTRTRPDSLPIDFDLEFITPATVEGDVIIDYQLCQNNNEGVDGVVASQIIVTFYKVDLDAAETSLGTYTETSSQSVGLNRCFYKTKSMKIAIARTHFKRGEKLRMELNGNTTGTTRGQTYIGLDPANRLDILPTDPAGIKTPDTSQFKVRVPFRIQP
jgi:hypothetical protein